MKNISAAYFLFVTIAGGAASCLACFSLLDASFKSMVLPVFAAATCLTLVRASAATLASVATRAAAIKGTQADAVTSAEITFDNSLSAGLKFESDQVPDQVADGNSIEKATDIDKGAEPKLPRSRSRNNENLKFLDLTLEECLSYALNNVQVLKSSPGLPLPNADSEAAEQPTDSQHVMSQWLSPVADQNGNQILPRSAARSKRGGKVVHPAFLWVW